MMNDRLQPCLPRVIITVCIQGTKGIMNDAPQPYIYKLISTVCTQSI